MAPVEADKARAIGILETNYEAAMPRAVTSRAIIKEIASAPASDDAPVAPVLAFSTGCASAPPPRLVPGEDMAFGIDDAFNAVKGVSDTFGKIIDKIWLDPAEAAKAKALLMSAEVQGDIQRLTAELGPILAEAQSPDKWTSRARPSFLYVMYTMILMAVPMGIVYTVHPATAAALTLGVKTWLAALPDGLWQLFGLGYLGYTGGRTFEKWKGMAK